MIFFYVLLLLINLKSSDTKGSQQAICAFEKQCPRIHNAVTGMRNASAVAGVLSLALIRENPFSKSLLDPSADLFPSSVFFALSLTCAWTLIRSKDRPTIRSIVSAPVADLLALGSLAVHRFEYRDPLQGLCYSLFLLGSSSMLHGISKQSHRNNGFWCKYPIPEKEDVEADYYRSAAFFSLAGAITLGLKLR